MTLSGAQDIRAARSTFGNGLVWCKSVNVVALPMHEIAEKHSLDHMHNAHPPEHTSSPLTQMIS